MWVGVLLVGFHNEAVDAMVPLQYGKVTDNGQHQVGSAPLTR